MEAILIASDGSPPAQEAVEFGLDLAAEQDSNVTFVSVAPAADVVPMGAYGSIASLPHEATEAEERPLDDAHTLAEQAGVTAYQRLLQGDPADDIVAYADTIDADLIVPGSRGHGMVASALLGSRRPVAPRTTSTGRASLARDSAGDACGRHGHLIVGSQGAESPHRGRG